MRSFAFFDVDGTIINLKSMFSLLHFLWIQPELYGMKLGNEKYLNYANKSHILYQKTMERTTVNYHYYKQYKGLSVKLVDELSKRWWQQVTKKKDIFNSQVCQRLREHQKMGFEPVFVSGAMMPCLRDLQTQFHVKHVLCTELIIEDGSYTGNIKRSIIGEGKAEAIKKFMRIRSGDYLSSYAYGDHHSDIPMMNLVGNAIAVNPDYELAKHAKYYNWHIIYNNS